VSMCVCGVWVCVWCVCVRVRALNICAFSNRHGETKKNPSRSFRSQELPNTDFNPGARHQN